MLSYIAKCILNHLLGRFGMRPFKDITKIASTKEVDDLLTKYSGESFNVGNGKQYVIYNAQPTEIYAQLFGEKKYADILIKNDTSKLEFDNSLPLAITVTANARIFMHKTIMLLENLGIKVFYISTDSVVTDKPLPDNLVGKLLGQFRLVDKIVVGYFIGPNFYGYLNDKNIFISKARGLGDSLTQEDFELLLKGETILKPKEK
jgi:hypothetical protein